MILIIGGSGSGKSSYAEELICQIADKGQKEENTNRERDGYRKYYLATMQVFDEEGRQKIEKHQKARSGKGFETIEQPTDILKAANSVSGKESVVLLECMSNLVANEMFGAEEILPKEVLVDKITSDVVRLSKGVKELVIVTNNVFEDGVSYDELTMAYNWALGEINRRLAKEADSVIEVVVGIPLFLKRGSKFIGDWKKDERN